MKRSFAHVIDYHWSRQFPGIHSDADFSKEYPRSLLVVSLHPFAQEVFQLSVGALRLFSLTYLTRWFSFATQSYMLAIEKPLPASLISVSTALVFPVLLVALLWPLGLTGIWLNFAGTSVLAAVMAGVILIRLRGELRKPDVKW